MSDEAGSASTDASHRLEDLADALARALPDASSAVTRHARELTYEVAADRLLETAAVLRDVEGLKFEMCMDVCGVDYLEYGRAEWKTQDATVSGFSRGVSRFAVPDGTHADALAEGRRFAVVYHLLSVSLNQRLRVRVYCPDDTQPMLDSLTGVWASVDWFERETFDLFGILFKGHPDLRRLLTDYGFIGHPFRKDFPLSGNVEVRYDPEKARVVYQPVSIDPRVLVPKVIRHDNRYDPALTNAAPPGKPNG
jgi:NADH-quinone oxidoreductase subunit C